MTLPKHLIESVEAGKAVLFLGAGASYGAKHPKGEKVPLGKHLADIISDKFLPEAYKGKPLDYVSELAISESDLFEVQKFIYEIFIDFGPSEWHMLVSKFVWRAIATTNFDLIIEKIYDSSPERLQDCVVLKKDGERIDEKIRSRRDLLLIKLHGCITEIDNEGLPLILTPSQYAKYKTNRRRLFGKLAEMAYDCPFIFVGYGYADPDIRYTIEQLSIGLEARPRCFMVGPGITAEEARLWESKRITSFKMTFEDFLHELVKKTKSVNRVLSIFSKADDQLPIFEKFKKNVENQQPSESLKNFLEYDVEYIHSNLATKASDPKKFYKGYFDSWDPILRNLDVQRELGDEIISEVFLQDETERRNKQDFYVIKGHAGSGKTVLLKRITWEAATEYNKLCFYVVSDSLLKFDQIAELYHLCKERLFLVVDNPTEFIEDLVFILGKCRRNNIPITILSAERINLCNTTEFEELGRYLTQAYTLKYLNDKEIKELIHLLEKHDSLGYLKNKSEEEQLAELSSKANRQLLVTLHEATMGKPFEDIIVDEFKSIETTEAKSLYLTICMMHMLGVFTRAGLISRVHGISFEQFRSRLFKPLESIVFVRKDSRTRDYVYLSRHQHIAEIVIDQILVDEQKKFEKVLEVVVNLDIDFKCDRIVFQWLTKAKNLMAMFESPEKVRDIYREIGKFSKKSPKLKQQEAIFEMKRVKNFQKAESLLNEAHKESKGDPSIAHSLAEFYFKKAEGEEKRLLQERYLSKCVDVCNLLLNNSCERSYIFHTLLKVYCLRLEKEISDEGEKIEAIIKDFERILSRANQLHPNDEYILSKESDFNKLLDAQPNALNALKKAFEANKDSVFIAMRLTQFYSEKNEYESAKSIFREALEYNPNQKDLNLKYALLLSKDENPCYIDIKHYLRKAFGKGDRRYFAHFLYARCLYVLEEYPEAKEFFDLIGNSDIPEQIKNQVRGPYKRNGVRIEYNGTITTIESTYGFVKRDGAGAGGELFFHKDHDHARLDWSKLKRNSRVKFNLAFSYRGPLALNLRMVT